MIQIIWSKPIENHSWKAHTHYKEAINNLKSEISVSEFGQWSNKQSSNPSDPSLVSKDLIKDSTTATFMEDVIAESQNVPVIVDFWAPNCAPCAQLTPSLENLVKEQKGKVKLVKINTQTSPDLAAQFRIQSVPTVYAFKDGQPVDGFAGAMPESELKNFIKKLTGDADALSEIIAAADEKREAGEAQMAADLYSQILTQDPKNPNAIAGLMKCYIDIGELEPAEQALTMMPKEIENHPAIKSAKAALDLALKSGDSGDLDNLIRDCQNNPDNLDKKFELAIAYNANNKREEAVDELISILRKNMQWNEGAAKTQLLEFFDAWGPKDENTVEGRKKLSSLLFA